VPFLRRGQRLGKHDPPAFASLICVLKAFSDLGDLG
jgi:hypothetical protein